MHSDAIEKIKPLDLFPYANNSRLHSEEQINQVCSSIKEFGFTAPILIDEENMVLAGHGRLAAAKKLNLEVVPCVRLKGLSEAQKKAYVIADNKLTENSEWDNSLLAIELQRLEELDFDLTMTGFSVEELSALMNIEELEEGKCDPDESPEPQAESITKPGDIWLLGKHKLLCGDSTRIEAVELLMGELRADVLITDPPYNVAYTGKTKDALKIQNDSMDDSDFRQFLTDAFSAADCVMKEGAVFYIWHADSEGYNFRGACKDVGWKVRQCLIWQKDMLVMGRQDYHLRHEPCLYGWKDGASHLWASDRKQTTLLSFQKPQKNPEHPTMKPVALIEYQLLNNTKGGDLVLDLFGGSGTTMIAAEKNGRVARLVEIDPKYCDVIVRRWQKFTEKEAVLELNGKTFNELSADV